MIPPAKPLETAKVVAASFADQQHEQHFPDDLAVQHLGDRFVAHAPELGEGEHGHAEDGAADHGDHRSGTRDAREPAGRDIESPREQRTPDSGGDAQQHIEGQFLYRSEFVAGHDEGRRVAQQCTAQRSREDRGHEDRTEGDDREVLEDHFEHEDGPGDRRVEGCGQAGRRAGADQRTHPFRTQAERLRVGRPEPGAELDHRSLRPDRGAGADRERVGDKADQGGPEGHLAPPEGDGVDDLGHPVEVPPGGASLWISATRSPPAATSPRWTRAGGGG